MLNLFHYGMDSPLKMGTGMLSQTSKVLSLFFALLYCTSTLLHYTHLATAPENVLICHIQREIFEQVVFSQDSL